MTAQSPTLSKTLPQSATAATNTSAAVDLSTLPAEIGADQAYAIVSSGQAPLIDIRSPMEWHQSGLPEGSVPISIHEPGFIEKLNDVLDNDKSRPFILICRTGNRSPHVVQALRQHGYSNIYEVPEGLFGSFRSPHPGWANRGLPMKPFNPYLMD